MPCDPILTENTPVHLGSNAFQAAMCQDSDSFTLFGLRPNRVMNLESKQH